MNAENRLTFTAVWPVWPEKPKGRPQTTNGTRHVSNIGNDQAMGIALVASNSHRCSAVGRVHSVGVDTQVDLAVVGVDETLVLRIALVKVLYKA